VLMNIPTIETERLRLRAFEGRDLEPYAEMYADDLFVRYLSGKALTKDQVWENMALILGHWSLLGYGIWAIERLGTGELVGRAGLLHLPRWPDVEVCWALFPNRTPRIPNPKFGVNDRMTLIRALLLGGVRHGGNAEPHLRDNGLDCVDDNFWLSQMYVVI
jgi:hypothetical protein